MSAPQPGFLAVANPPGITPPPMQDALACIGVDRARTLRLPRLSVAGWGLGQGWPGPDRTALLSLGARRRDRDVSALEVHRLIRAFDLEAISEMLPPFAAVAVLPGDTLVAVSDPLAYRHIYYCRFRECVAVSTSPRALAAWSGAALDTDAIAVQALLGWQLGQRTFYRGIHKQPPGVALRLTEGELRLDAGRSALGDLEPIGLTEAVERAAGFLRHYVGRYLDEHPDPTLQLTGGQDSRLLLSSIPVERRRDLRVMTLHVPGTDDARIAATLASRYAMRHHVLGLGDLKEVTPEEAHELCVLAADRLECMADPLAFAALQLAEGHFDQGPRLSGLGGEVARGFYYTGSSRARPVTMARAAQLASWRMLANESVATDALTPDFARHAREIVIHEVYSLLRTTGMDWLPATDELYLGHRMQRWAGVTDTAVCFDRPVTNPMLDDRFLRIGRGLSPRNKRNSVFLGRLQVALDPDLASVPLDGRPPPSVYATRTLTGRARMAASTAQKARRKMQQRLARANRPPAGGAVLAARTVEHWQRYPDELHRLADLDVFRPSWIESVVRGSVTPSPSAVALLTSLVVAQLPTAQRPESRQMA